MSRRLLAVTIVLLLFPAIEVAAPGFLSHWATSLGFVEPVGTVALEPGLEADTSGSPASEMEDDGSGGGLVPPEASSTTIGNNGSAPAIKTPEGSPNDGADRATEPSSSIVDDREEPSDQDDRSGESAVGGDSTVPVGEEPPPIALKELTGDIQGTVTGTSELTGDVNLTGDLVVDGGLLLARAGVALEGNGFQIVVTRGGKLDWQGTATSTWSDKGNVVNLVRDININNVSRLIFTGQAGASTIRYVSVANSGTPELGFYPIHWHLNGDSTRGTLVEGTVVVNGANHAYVPHGSHGITIKDSIAKNTTGTPFWWDAPGTNESCQFQKFCTVDNSNDSVWDHNLVDGVNSDGFRATGFLLGAGSGNVIRNSTATRVGGRKDCSAFHWPEHANQNEGGNVWVFQNNHGDSNCHGIFVWQNDGNRHVIEGFSGGGISHGAYGNNYEYRDVDVPYLDIHAIGWSIANSNVGAITAVKHAFPGTVTLSEVAIGSFTVKDGGGEPATYVLERTNLRCSDIVWEDSHPDSQVVIDSETC